MNCLPTIFDGEHILLTRRTIKLLTIPSMSFMSIPLGNRLFNEASRSRIKIIRVGESEPGPYCMHHYKNGSKYTNNSTHHCHYGLNFSQSPNCKAKTAVSITMAGFTSPTLVENERGILNVQSGKFVIHGMMVDIFPYKQVVIF